MNIVGQRVSRAEYEAICAGKTMLFTSPDWTPTPENINALPDPVRKYIHDLQTNVDPQGLVRQNHILQCEVAALRAEIETIKKAAPC